MNALDLFSSATVGILFAVGTYFMLSWNLQRVAIGFLFISNGVNLSIVAASGLPARARPPLIVGDADVIFADPLPQAFVLTAIVIGLGMAAFLLALAVRYYRDSDQDSLIEKGSNNS